MNEIIIEKLREVKDGIFSEVMGKINEIENVSTNFNHTNLKIHNVSYYLYQAVQNGIITNEQSLSLFQHICEMEYETFEEWESENLNYVKRAYIGRTSSFYYDSKWYGDVVEQDVVEELLEGKTALKDCLKGLDARIYEILIEGKNLADFPQWDDDDVSEILEGEEEFLTLLSDDLDTVLEIVNEAKKAYDYLKEYKKGENILAIEYLSHEIGEYYGEEEAEKLFDSILENIEKLNKVETLKVSYVKNETSKTYELNVSVNGEEFSIDTKIKFEHELSEKFINSTIECLNHKINESFEL